MLTPRFTGLNNKENTERALMRDYQAPAYAAVVNLATKLVAGYTLINMTLTGTITFNIGVGDSLTPPMVGDELVMILVSSGSSQIATFGTGFASTGTLTATLAKYACIKFIFNGTVWQETGRTVTA